MVLSPRPKQQGRTARAAARLTQAVKEIAALRLAAVDRLKLAAKAWDDPHFIWNALLLSFATMGNSRGAKLVEDESIRVKVDFEALRRLSGPQRRIAIYDALIEATVRMPRIKTTWLMDNHERIVADGGPARVKAMLEACPGREAKIGFLMSFRGIGDKYARNILMDVHHPEFRQSIAYDERLKKVSEALGVSFGSSYRAAEEFFLGVAEDAGLSGWELDRLLYGYTKEVLAALGKAECRSAALCKSELGSLSQAVTRNSRSSPSAYSTATPPAGIDPKERRKPRRSGQTARPLLG